MDHQLTFDRSLQKKVRGLKRRYKEIEDMIIEQTEIVPDPSECSLGYWHLHLPWGQDYIMSRKTPNKFRRALLQLLINRVNHLIKLKSEKQMGYQIYAIITFPNLFYSKIVVLPDSSWFDGFFERESKEQKWIPLDDNRNISKEWNVVIPSELKVRGFKEIIFDDDFNYESELWFIGEVS